MIVTIEWMPVIITTFFMLCIAAIINIIKSMVRTNRAGPRKGRIPIVSGGLPLVGHGLTFGKDIIGFCQKACIKYGKIFKIKIFRKYLIVICDRELIKEYFHSTEASMSLGDALSSLYFDYGFSDNISDEYNFVDSMIGLIKKSIMVRFDLFAPTIMDEAKAMIDRLKNDENIKNKRVKLLDVITKFVAHTSARCFIGIKLTEEFYGYLCSFKEVLNQIVILTYFLPKSLLRATIGRLLRRYRKKMTHLLHDEIEKYRVDKTKNDSFIIRKSVDFYDEELKRGFNNDEIGDIIVCLLYVSTENTALGLSSVIMDLAINENGKYWDKVEAESHKLFESNNLKEIFSSKFLNLVIHESARLNTHIFAINRMPKTKKYLGGYYIGKDSFCGHGSDDNYCVAICQPMLMKFKYAEQVYNNPMRYNPYRFIHDKSGDKTKKAESRRSYDLMTWGAGEHLCPGKRFAIYEMIAALMFITTNFKRLNISPADCEKIDYFSPSAFAKRDATVLFEPL